MNASKTWIVVVLLLVTGVSAAVWPSTSFFYCPFDGKGTTYDNSVIHAQTKP